MLRTARTEYPCSDKLVWKPKTNGPIRPGFLLVPDMTSPPSRSTLLRHQKRPHLIGTMPTNRNGDRLQQLRAVLPCEVRVVAETHPLFGRLLAAKSFKRWNGVVLLVIDLPDGFAGNDPLRCH